MAIELLKKKWICLNCGYQFETPWIPRQFVRCPRCGSNNVCRAVDETRGSGGPGKRFRWGQRE